MKKDEANYLLGKRCLLAHKHWYKGAVEAEIKEVSPSGDYIRLLKENDLNASWETASDWEVVEVLPKIDT